jgi:hypothetical protein
LATPVVDVVVVDPVVVVGSVVAVGRVVVVGSEGSVECGRRW